MINILPKEDQEEIKAEYARRFVALFSGMAFVSIIFSVILLAPLYVFVKDQERVFKSEEKLSFDRFFLSRDTRSETAVSDLKNKISILLDEDAISHRPSEVIENIISKRGREVSVNGIHYRSVKDEKGETVKEIAVTGSADTRGDLVSFVDSLKNDKSFGGIESPVSNYLKEKDSEYGITIKMK